jgi:hypothetical protein
VDQKLSRFLNVRSLLLVVLVGLGLVSIPGLFETAHASPIGRVCLADVSSAPSPPADPCPGSGLFFNGPVTSPGQQIRIGVFVNGSAGLGGFAITLLADSTVLKPAGVDLTGTVVPGTPLILAECLSGVLVSGSTCASTDTLGTLDLAVVTFASNTASPTTGLLFTAIYNITGTSSVSGIPIGFQSGCSQTSVSPNICVTIPNGTVVADVETIQGATFNNSTPPPYLTVSSNSSTVGPMIAQSVRALGLTLTGQGMWASEGCPCPATLSTLANNSLTVRLNTTSLNVPSSGSVFVAMNVTGTMAGNFSVTLLAQYPVLDLSNFNTSTLVAHVTVTVIVTDFSLSANPLNMSPVLSGIAASSQVTITSVNGFVGTVALTATSSSYQCGLTPTSLVVSGSASSSLNCSAASAGNYTVTVTAGSGLDSHIIQIGFSVQDFAISLSSSVLSATVGSNDNITLSVSGLNGFAQLVTLSIAPPVGLTIVPMTSTFSAPRNVTLSFSADAVGVYNVTVTVSSSTVHRSAMLQVKVSPAPSNGSSTLFGLAPVLFYSLLAALGAIVVVAAVLMLRRRDARAVRSLGAKRISRKKRS